MIELRGVPRETIPEGVGMLTTRLWMGTVLVILTVGMLVADQFLAPWYPFLWVLVVGLGLVACWELLNLLGPRRQPQPLLCYLGVAGIGTANWIVHTEAFSTATSPWNGILGFFIGLVILVFLVEMASFHELPSTQPQRDRGEGGQSVERMALALWVVIYLGLLPCFLAQQRWMFTDPVKSSVAMALTVFVPKCGDIGAYLTGRMLGKHPMTPVLSPKKTWEGAAGGLTLAVLTALAIDRLGPVAVLRGDLAWEIGFGVTVGIAGMLGDLAESLIKRDCRHKDASGAVPGFGGVLDVIDAVLFAAPAAYVWLIFANPNMGMQ